MSEALEAVEAFENSSKGINIRFQASEDFYDFNFTDRRKYTMDKITSLTEKISNKWQYKNKLDVPIIFSSMDETILLINLNINIRDIKKSMVTVTGFSISRKYDKAKELAEYMLKPEVLGLGGWEKSDAIYNKFKDDLEKNHIGKTVAIDNDAGIVAGIGSSMIDAYQDAIKNKKSKQDKFNFYIVGYGRHKGRI